MEMSGVEIRNRYRIIRLIGEGGMAFVYLACDMMQEDLPVALKIMKKDKAGPFDKVALGRFKTEYEILTRLKHSNLVRVYDFGYDTLQEICYIVMEHIEGKTLREYLRLNTMDLRQAMDIMTDLLRATTFIHSRNIIVRDIKPENIMISDNDIKLLDFGLSDLEKTEQYKMKGSVQYLAPEVFSGLVDLRVDIYSLGVLLYELITGYTIFHGKNYGQILRIMGDRKLFESECRLYMRNIPVAGMRHIIYKMLEFDKKRRYKNCREIIQDFNRTFDVNYDIETKRTIQAYIHDNPFIGRKKQFQRLKSSLHRKSRKIKAIIISGPSGSGKNTLLNEFKKYCKLSYIPLFEADSARNEDRIYYPLLDIIENMLLYSPKKLIDRYGKFFKRLLPANNMLKDQSIFDTGSLLKDKGIIEQNMIDFMVDFAVDYKKVFSIIAGDLSKIPENSLTIISRFLKRAEHEYRETNNDINFAIYFFCNEEDRHFCQALLKENALSIFTEIIELKPLTKGNIYQYFQRIFGKGLIDSSIRSNINYIKEMVGGNPLNLRSVLWSVLDNDGFYFNKTRWAFKEGIFDSKVMASVESMQRDRIKKTVRDTGDMFYLQVLSLIRSKFGMLELKTLLGQKEGVDIPEKLKNWERLDILTSENIKNNPYFRFSHVLIRDIIRQDIKNKRKIHEYISTRLEKLYKGGFLYVLEELVYHILLAKNYHKASKYLIRAAINAEAEFDYKKASDFYLKLIKIIDKNDPNLLYNYEQAGKMLSLSGDWDNAIKVYKKGLRLGDKSCKHHFYDGIGIVYYYKGDYEHSLKNYKRALSMKKIFFGENSYEVADSYINLASLYQARGHYDTAKEYLDKHYNIISKVIGEVSIEVSVYYNNLGMLFLSQGQSARGFKSLYRSLKIKRKLLDECHPQMAISYNNLGIALKDLANIKLALKCYETSLKIKSLHFGEDFIELANIYNNLGMLYFEEKKTEEAEKNIKKSIVIWEKFYAGPHINLSIAYNNLGMINMLKGEYDKALDCYLRSLKIFKGSSLKNYSNLFGIYSNLSHYMEKTRQFDMALNYSRKSYNIAKKFGLIDEAGLKRLSERIKRLKNNP